MQDRYLYLARHGEAASEEGGLTDAGRRQAGLLGTRLRGVPLTAVHHGPLPRAAQTARFVAAQLDGVPLRACEEAGDYVPYVPERDELPPEVADSVLARLSGVSAEERAQGAELARRARAAFTGPVREGPVREGLVHNGPVHDGPVHDNAAPRHELVVTHAFLVACGNSGRRTRLISA